MRSWKRGRNGRVRTKRRIIAAQLYQRQIVPVWERPRRCVWTWLLALQMCLVVDEGTHKRYEVVAIPLVDTAEQRSPDAKFWDYDDGVQNYLMRYGYLERSNIETGNLRTIDELQQAVRKLQVYGNLERTGTVDEATLELMRKPRCGAPDVPDSLDFLPSNDRRLGNRRFRRYVIQGQRWQNAIVTWSLVNQSMAQLDAGQVRRILHEALDLWSQHANINFREVYSSEADIQVLFARKFHGDGYSFDGAGKILAHAFYPGTGIGGDAHFDEEETWLLNEPLDAEGTRLFDVAVHEFGHSLGLGHSSQQDAIMFPWHHISYRGKDTIPEDDRLGIESIYGPRKKIYGKNPERPTQSTTTTTTTTTPAPPPRPTTRPHYPRKEVAGHPWEDFGGAGRPQMPQTTTTTEAPRSREYFPHPARPTSSTHNNRHPQRHHTTTTTTTAVSTTTSEPTTTRHRQHHRPHHHHPTTSTTSTTRRPYQHRPGVKPLYPNACNTSFDAVTMIRNELFVFKDRWLWRMNENDLHRPKPIEINRMFFGLPDGFDHIDTVYENKYQKIIFFIGREYFVFNSQYLEPGYPRPLTDLGLPESIERIDSALVWTHNNRTYLYSGRLYWRFDEDTNQVELDYPRDMSIWKGIGYGIDAALQYRDGKTYFFKGLGYWRFNDMRMSVAHDQKPSATRWMKCQNERQVQNDLGGGEDGAGADGDSPQNEPIGTSPASDTVHRRHGDPHRTLLSVLLLAVLALVATP